MIKLDKYMMTVIIVIFIIIIIINFFSKSKEIVNIDPVLVPQNSEPVVNNDDNNDNEQVSDHLIDISVDSTPDIPREIVTEKVYHRGSKKEELCRMILKELTGKDFNSIRPEFLRNPETKRNLELDCYNEELGIALEYNGKQHYIWPNFTGQSREEFIKQIRRDIFKVDMCDRNNIYLITVPYNVRDNQLRSYIRYFLEMSGMKF